MRMIGRLLALFLVFACPLLAKADPLDFKLNVQDPAGGGGISTNPFTFTFGACYDPKEADGCFYGQNITGEAWTSLTFTVPDTGYILQTDQQASCGGTGDLFTVATCDPDPVDGNFTLTFSGGEIANYGVFLFTEDGVPFEDFPEVTVVADTPEPSSLILFGMGLLASASVGSGKLRARWRRERA